eukprot:CAMPEP_0115714314 /NCGR_PEP_ID=MMETSP0272-20121206/75167_1 /TAXON_ID=71861 /ORGANISM="Scrippsiella trochoidea, Strain CCMP3099" /LENGTH=79 /DNA_ID=CAMNT_0003156439 /DNA_START=24 /DNA_END=260 /DNA_ORIENTATION=-
MHRITKGGKRKEDNAPNMTMPEFTKGTMSSKLMGATTSAKLGKQRATPWISVHFSQPICPKIATEFFIVDIMVSTSTGI